MESITKHLLVTSPVSSSTGHEPVQVQIIFSKLYREKLYGKSFLNLGSPGGPLWLSLMGRKFFNFEYCRLLGNAISNKNKKEAPKQAQLK